MSNLNVDKKILMLWPNKNDYWPRMIKKRDSVDIDDAFYNKGLIYGAIRKVLASHGLFLGFLLGEWKYNLNKYDIVILQASLITSKVPNYMRKKGYTGRIIYWYWDPVSGSINPNFVDRNLCELWSFDQEDCRKYNMYFNDTFYVFDDKAINQTDADEYDFSFVGKDKGRKKFLDELQMKLNEFGFNSLFYIVATKSYYFGAKKLKPMIEYEKIIDIVKKSRVIIDVNQEEQSGLSQRCMEAIVFNKKLITTNNHIVDYPIYDPSRIYVIDRNNVTKDRLNNFIRKKFFIDESLMQYYDFDVWLKRFKDRG